MPHRSDGLAYVGHAPEASVTADDVLLVMIPGLLGLDRRGGATRWSRVGTTPAHVGLALPGDLAETLAELYRKDEAA